MPLYDYVCPEGHKTTDFRMMSEREDPCECSTCGANAEPGFFGKKIKASDLEEQPKEAKIKVTYRNGNLIQFHFRDYACKDCEAVGEVDCTNDDNEHDPSVARCEECGSDNLEIYAPGSAIDRFSERFPYFDRGLGVMLQSKRHRREVMKKKGVVAVDGDLDIGMHARKAASVQREDESILRDMRERLDEHPGYKEYRQLRDRGWKPNFNFRR